MKEHLVWHPDVHARFLDELVFYFISVRAFPPQENVYNAITDVLEDTGHTSYRMHRVFGSYDIVLKVWVKKGEHEELGKEIKGKSHYVHRLAPAVVEGIRFHSNPEERAAPQEAAVFKLFQKDIESVQGHFDDEPKTWRNDEPIRSKLADSVLRIVSDLPPKMMVFFVCITHADTEEMEPHALLGAITDQCQEFSKQGKAVIYRTKTKYGFIVKLETEDPYSAGRFVVELNDKFSLHEATTETYVVMESRIRGKEEIGTRSFQQVEHRDPLTTYIFPRLYGIRGVSQTRKLEVALWINDKFSPSLERLTLDDLDVIRQCLLAVITNKEVGFSLAIAKPFLEAERELRTCQNEFLGRLGLNPEQAIRDALRPGKNGDEKKSETLTLGDRIKVYQDAIKKGKPRDEKDILSRCDKDVLSDWAAIVELRNQVAHHSENLFPRWAEGLTLLVEFMVRYKKLQTVIHEIFPSALEARPRR
jgi:uncharacterized protein with GYD domain